MPELAQRGNVEFLRFEYPAGFLIQKVPTAYTSWFNQNRFRKS